MKRLLKKLLPSSVFRVYHEALSLIAPLVYRYPSKKLLVIGITGTTGKSTTIEFMASVLEAAGNVVGVASTIKFKVGKKEWLNDKKMTMVGRFQLQRLLNDMVKAGCTVAIVETTSEGIVQSRHKGVHYDTCVFTNLYPEHIDSHGSFENYKAAKLRLFEKLARDPHKKINGKKIPKTIIANLDSEHAVSFLNFDVDAKIGFSATSPQKQNDIEVIIAEHIQTDSSGVRFTVQGVEYTLAVLGEHNVYNAIAALAVGTSLRISNEQIQQGLETVTGIPGRIERINEGQSFTVIVDYAFEPEAMKKLYSVVRQLNHQKIIQVLGTTGGGRDKDRGEKLGKMAGSFCDIVIPTNEDPYDDDPQVLMKRVVKGVLVSDKRMDHELFPVLDRKRAIRKALELAQQGDVVLITGKGSEQGMVVAHNKIIPWDDREVVKDVLKEIA